MIGRLLIAISAFSAVAASAPTVTLPSGATVTGATTTNVAGNVVNVFRGIPYAEPPVGDRRWKPSSLKPLNKDINATAFSHVCYGTALDPVSFQLPASEDCLYLNVFAPSGATSESKLPVLVWVHGGAFVAGSAHSDSGINLLAAANENLIVVSLNYRLGVFGFFSNSEVLAQGGGANFGLQDQEVAFAWIKKYIEHFGGDPEQITAFGESAGSMSLAMHMISRDGNQQLFKRAILQSGAYTTTFDTLTREGQDNQTLTIAKAVGCGDAKRGQITACMRGVNASIIFETGQSLVWIPIVDGVYMEDMPVQRVLDGKVSRVPTIIGTNTDEGWLFTFETGDFESFVRNRFTRLTDAEYARIIELYPASAFETAHHRAGELFGDVIFVCPSEHFSRTLADIAGPPTYRYHFNFTSNEYGYPLVVHAKDVSFVFNDVDSLPNDADTKRVVDHFQTYWTNFAIANSPNGNEAKQSALMSWPQFDAMRKQIVIQPELAVETNSVDIPGHAERCAFWLEVEKRVISDVHFA